jgi:transcriptional regulator with XRE-family HTH domain
MSTAHSDRHWVGEVPPDTFEMRLAMARIFRGMSAAEAAMRVGVTGQAWRNWENGKSVGARKPSMLGHIARQLDVDEDWLRDGGEMRKAPHPGGPDGGPGVRRQGLEPRTQWFSGRTGNRGRVRLLASVGQVDRAA